MAIPVPALDAETQAAIRDDGERGGLAGAELDQYVTDTIAYAAATPERHLAKIHLYGEGGA